MYDTFTCSNVKGMHSNMATAPFGNPIATLHLIAASCFPSIFLSEEDRKYFNPLSEVFREFIKETGYFHIQATKPDTVGKSKFILV